MRIAIIKGGQSAEAEVSQVSAAGVKQALLENYAHVEAIELDEHLVQALAKFKPDVVFPVLHGPPGEDGTLQGFLEILNYLYVGSDVHASSAAMNKVLAKQIFASVQLPLADELVLRREQGQAMGETALANAVAAVTEKLGHYVVVKPSTQGSALGVTLVDNANQLHDAIATAFQLDHQVLIEQRIDGKEITVGVLDTADGPRALPVIEITTQGDSWYDYEHRYTKGLCEHIVPAQLSEAQTKRLQDIAVAAHVALGCRDLSRADFVVASDTDECLLEVNTLPGMTPTSLYPDGAKAYGLDFPSLVSYLVERAAAR